MKTRILNCFTCNARFPAHLKTSGTVFLLETEEGLILVDTGIGELDYQQKPFILRLFQLVTKVPLDPEEAAIFQISELGYSRKDVRHIVLTHMHFDHCGGIPDFPDAVIHVYRKEFEAFKGRRKSLMDWAYVRRHIAHQPHFETYELEGGQWMGFDAVRIRVEPEMYLVPLPGHTAGHCGVAFRSETGWVFHVGDAASAEFTHDFPGWIERLVLGPHIEYLENFRVLHPDIRMTSGHMLVD